jgi:hypothetical protein
MPGVRRGRRLLSGCELAPSRYRLTAHDSSEPFQVVVRWCGCRGRLYGFYAPDDAADLRSGERSHVEELADPSIACVDGSLPPEHTLALRHLSRGISDSAQRT